MILSELLNAVEIDGDLILKLWDDENERYLLHGSFYDELSETSLEYLYDRKVSHIYPGEHYPDIIVELTTED